MIHTIWSLHCIPWALNLNLIVCFLRYLKRVGFISEMMPQWYSIASIPYKNMWPDDELWFPLMLRGKSFSGYFKFEGMDTIVDYTLSEVDAVSE